MNKYSAEDIVDIVNSKISLGNVSYEDSRVSRELTVRRLRDYVYKGLVSPPCRDGRKAVFTDKHLDEIYNVRMMNISGYSDSVIKKETERHKTQMVAQDEDEELKAEDSIDDMIASMKKNVGSNHQLRSTSNSGTSSYLISNLLKNLDEKKEKNLPDIEHYISEDGKTYLKVDKNKLIKINSEDVEDAITNSIYKIDIS